MFSPTDAVVDVVRAEGGSFVFGEVEFKSSFEVDAVTAKKVVVAFAVGAFVVGAFVVGAFVVGAFVVEVDVVNTEGVSSVTSGAPSPLTLGNSVGRAEADPVSTEGSVV